MARYTHAILNKILSFFLSCIFFYYILLISARLYVSSDKNHSKRLWNLYVKNRKLNTSTLGKAELFKFYIELLAIKHYKNYKEGCVDTVLLMFKSVGINTKYIGERYISILLDIVFSDISNSEQLIIETEKLDVDSLNTNGWISLYVFFIMSGFISASRIAYGNAVLLSKPKKNSIYKYRKLKNWFNACINSLEIDYARDALIEIDKKYSKKDRLNVFYSKWVYSLFKGEEIINNSIMEINSSFKNIVNGKSIALVGPGPSKNDNCEEINKFDVIVRLNCRCNIKTPYQEIRTDISYYNGSKSKFLMNSTDQTIPYGLKYAVFKSNNSLKLTLNTGVKSRVIHPFDVIFYGGMNMIQAALFDLLLYRPSRIKLFNTSLFIPEDDVYGDSSYQLEALKKIDYLSMFVTHNPIIQFNLLKGLLRSGIISADHSLNEILELSLQEFMELLELHYKNHSIINKFFS